MAIEIGQQAPEFALKNAAGDTVTRADVQAGKPVLLVFYPFTFTGVCEAELCQLREDLSQFEAVGVQIVAISCDSRHAQRVWGEQQQFTFPFLSDFWPHGAAAEAFGNFNEAVGCANRASFLIDGAGVLVDSFGTDDLGTPREADRYVEAIAKL